MSSNSDVLQPFVSTIANMFSLVANSWKMNSLLEFGPETPSFIISNGASAPDSSKSVDQFTEFEQAAGEEEAAIAQSRSTSDTSATADSNFIYSSNSLISEHTDRSENSSSTCSLLSKHEVGKWSPKISSRTPWEGIKRISKAISFQNMEFKTEDGSLKVHIGTDLLFVDLTIDVDFWCESWANSCECPFIFLDHASTPELERAAEEMLGDLCHSIRQERASGPPLCVVLARVLSQSSSCLHLESGAQGLARALGVLDAELKAGEEERETTQLTYGADDDLEGADHDEQCPEPAEDAERIAAHLMLDALAVVRTFPHVTVAAVRPKQSDTFPKSSPPIKRAQMQIFGPVGRVKFHVDLLGVESAQDPEVCHPQTITHGHSKPGPDSDTCALTETSARHQRKAPVL